MRTWAQLDANSVCTNVIVADAEFAALFPAGTMVDVDNLDPQPGIGWTLAGETWTPPPAAPDEPAPDPDATAAATVATLAAFIPGDGPGPSRRGHPGRHDPRRPGIASCVGHPDPDGHRDGHPARRPRRPGGHHRPAHLNRLLRVKARNAPSLAAAVVT